MLKKNKCPHCEEKIRNSHSFCPNCGSQLKESKNKHGMLGKNDFQQKQITPKIFSGIGGGMMNKLLSKMVTDLTKTQGNLNEKDIQEAMKQLLPGAKISIKKVNKPLQNNTKFLPIDFSNENLKKWKSLSKKEPESKLKRVDNKINYELEIPEVKSIKDISIIKLENSMEVRAVGEKIAYLKRIPINLPLKKYSLLKGFLTLEMDAE